MDLIGPLRRFDRHQQQSRWLAIPIAVIKKFGNDQAGNLAALFAYYAFFSLFPLLLVFVTILGFVLQGNPSAQESIRTSLVGQLPVIGTQVEAHALTGNTLAIVVGVIGSLWGGLGVTNAAQNALDRVWAVPFKDRPDFLRTRLRGLLLLLCVSVLFIVSTVISGLVTGLGGPFVKVGGIAVGLVANFALFLVAFRFLTSAVIPTRCLWLGVAFASVFWEILQLGGGLYINHVLAHASNAYGTFAVVIGFLVWLHLGAQMTLYAAEINVVVQRKLYPRSLFGPPEAPADRETLEALAKVEERHDEERIDVRFTS